MTGKKVLQTLPSRLASSVEWEPIKESFHVKLKTLYGDYLRASGGPPPRWNRVTRHPHQTATRDWVLLEVEVMLVDFQSTPANNFLFMPL
ncbi:hypothetical protein SUGI_0123110 [Cryptomeria japonica]|nr:hypothetical protein SUGI_0123110 [Cryptomeria japonica]